MHQIVLNEKGLEVRSGKAVAAIKSFAKPGGGNQDDNGSREKEAINSRSNSS